MIETIYIGMSGLTSHSNGLRGIANNVANLNTPGYKSTTLQFGDLFYSGGAGGGDSGAVGPRVGHGVYTGGTTLNFRQGDLRQTGNALDLAVEGQGFFVLRDDAGGLRYTRAGAFEFGADGVLVDRASGATVMALASDGSLQPLTIADRRVSAPKPTGSIVFGGNLSSTKSEETINGLSVVDAAGAEHALSLHFTREAAPPEGRWKVALREGTTAVGEVATLDFIDGRPKAGAATLSFRYQPAGQPAMTLSLDFGGQVTSFASGSLSTIAVASHDGRAAGAMSSSSFDDRGVLRIAFANGETADGPRLALADVSTPQLLQAAGSNAFTVADGVAVRYGSAGDGAFGALRPGTLEISNVDLSQQFSDMVIMQRGYQASAQVVSTANDMLQDLFGMRR